jgi:hypothetical protein
MAFVPHYEEAFIAGDEKEYPFIHVDHKSRLNREGRSANCTWYYDFKDVDPGDVAWADVAKINPSDARGLDLKDGDKVKDLYGKIVGGRQAGHDRQVLRPGPLGLWPGGVHRIRQDTAGWQQQ